MQEKMNCAITGQSCPVLSRPSFKDLIKHAEEQIEIGAIEHYANQAHELCMIMAEVWMMNPSDKLRISGEVRDVYMVQEVFDSLTCEHIKMVLNNFQGITYLVQNRKAYLRAALYNAVFELESYWENRTRHDLKGDHA